MITPREHLSNSCGVGDHANSLSETFKREVMAYNRLPSSGHNSPSSPPRSPRLRHSQSKGGRFSPAQPPSTVARRLTGLLLSVLLRRQGIFLFAPLLYISGMLFYMGTVSFDVVPIINQCPAPGSVYRSPQLYVKLRPKWMRTIQPPMRYLLYGNALKIMSGELV